MEGTDTNPTAVSGVVAETLYPSLRGTVEVSHRSPLTIAFPRGLRRLLGTRFGTVHAVNVPDCTREYAEDALIEFHTRSTDSEQIATGLIRASKHTRVYQINLLTRRVARTHVFSHLVCGTVVVTNDGESPDISTWATEDTHLRHFEISDTTRTFSHAMTHVLATDDVVHSVHLFAATLDGRGVLTMDPKLYVVNANTDT